MYSDEHRRELAANDVPVDGLPRFIEVAGFFAEWTGLGLTEADLHVLQLTLASRPTAWAVVAGTNGVRKIRFSAPGSGRGKSGGFRVFYLPVVEHAVVVLVVTLSKSERENLTKAERNAVAKLVATVKAGLEKEAQKP
ncbi:hypothetical protein [Paludisphaera mucosa]|uniref:Toxin HigB-2 n=1 Tax=Paludisphaera mucosa TaxID=3030827 RepID=A0ABT6FLC5_9BACT|nr:hypothetical protein [Paludisphaera mucosa]MDG3008375.1 hypothetical protein [Paludisphaera mucosa]